MSEWQNDKGWSDRFLPQIKRILGEHLISEPPIEEDSQHNTDLIVLRLAAVRIACRIRKNSYITKYGSEFTIRSGRPSGVKTELTKIIEGWGDYFFYGFSNDIETEIEKWMLGDLKAFRIYFMRCLYAKEEPWISKKNADASSDFFVFKQDKIPDFLVAQSAKAGDKK